MLILIKKTPPQNIPYYPNTKSRSAVVLGNDIKGGGENNLFKLAYIIYFFNTSHDNLSAVKLSALQNGKILIKSTVAQYLILLPDLFACEDHLIDTDVKINISTECEHNTQF